MTFHARRTANGTRRVFYAHIDNNGSIMNNSEISMTNTLEGYPTLAVDPVSGKPMYAWHANYDTDDPYEDLFTSDAFLGGLSGLFNDIAVIQNAPITITPSNAPATSDNEFIWPSAVIGPSPINGKRRVYILMRNGVTHTYGPCENAYIRFADFNADDIENGVPLIWNTSNQTIPEMDDWNHDDQWRRPFHALAVDNFGNLYYAGYHLAREANGTTYIDEPDMDVFKCPNYGQGTWTRISAFSNLPSWNPPTSASSSTGYFTDDSGVPYADNELTWVLMNSGHINAVVDDNGKLHFPGLWGLQNSDHTFYSNLQFMKEFVYDPETSQMNIRDIYPQRNPANTHDTTFQPWDTAAPWGVVDQWGGDQTSGFYPLMTTDWDFPYWDSTAHSDAMMFHYNNFKMTETNGHGMMACVWQNSQRARWATYYADTNYAAYANTPEICISVSPDNGITWSEPIYLNNVDTPQLAGIKPMWVYPADKVKFMGMQGGQKIGRLGFMFYNDYTWGANALTPPVHPTNDGGQVMFMELEIVFPVGTPTQTDPFGPPVVLSSSMTVMAGVMIEGQNASSGDVVAAFVDVNGTPQLRGKGTVQVNNNLPGCLLQVYTETNGENIYFEVWDVSLYGVLNVAETTTSQVNGTVGSWPNDLFWLHAGTPQTQTLSLVSGWNMVSLNVHPENTQISSIFAGILENTVMIKSPEGVYVPNNPFNTLTNFTDGRGYMVKTSANRTLTVHGATINLSNPISLSSGWNLTGYTPQSPLSVSTALASIAAQLVQVKGVEGTYEPGNPYSTLTTLSPGRAYWIRLNAPASLIYPAPAKTSEQAQEILSSVVFGTPILKSDSESVLCALDADNTEGDLLAAFTNGELRGLARLKTVQGKTGTLINVFTEESSEPIAFKLLKSNGQIIDLEPGLLSEPGAMIGDYASGYYQELKPKQNEVPDISSGFVSAFPNPFSGSTTIRFQLAKEDLPLQMDIFNIKGQKVRTLFSGKLGSGLHDLNWNAMDETGQRVSSGIYFCRLSTAGKTQNLKLMIIK